MLIDNLTHYLTLLPRISYESVRCWQRQGAKPLGQCSLNWKHQLGQELGVSSMVTRKWTADKRREWKQAKDADRLEPKGKWSSLEVTISSNEDVLPPAKRQHLTYSGIYAERRSSRIVPFGESESQGKPIAMRVWDSRKSECRFVMKRIKVETSPYAKASRTKGVVFLNKKSCWIRKERKANDGSLLTSWCASRYESSNGQQSNIVESVVVAGAFNKMSVWKAWAVCGENRTHGS